MDFRKLIKFGNSSHVISLPRAWLIKNKLNKGDVIYFQENGGNELVLSPAELKFEKEEKSVVIDASKKGLDTIRRELTAAYVRGYNVIKIVDKNLKDRAVDIRNELQNLMAMEIMEQTQTSITAKDMLNTKEIDLRALIRRMDTTVRSMMEDLKDSVKEGIEAYKHLSYRDQDINRTYFVVFRVTNMGMEDSRFASSLKLSAKDLFDYWNTAFYLENFADEVKRIAELLVNIKISKEARKYLYDVLGEIEAAYSSVLKSYYTNDIPSALAYSDTRRKLFERCSQLYSELNRRPVSNLRVLAVTERFKDMIEILNQISRVVYN